MNIQIQVRNHTVLAPISADRGNQSISPVSSTRRPFTSLLTLAMILAIVGLSSCVGLTNAGPNAKKSTGGTGTLSASATSLSFGNVAVGNNKIQSVTITNTGTAAINLSEAAITGAGYTVAGGNSSITIPAGQSGMLQIQLAPASAGVINGSLSIESNAANSTLKIALTGTGTEPVLAVLPGKVQFGNVKVGQSTTQAVTLVNNGNVDLVLSAAQISGSGFAMSGLTFPSTIAAAKNVSFNVKFAPSAAQGMTGSIKFVDNAPNSTQSVDLAGTGTSENAALVATPGSVSFGNVTVGSSGSQSVTLTNSGASAIAISQAAAIGHRLQHQRPKSDDAECRTDRNIYGKVCANCNGKRCGRCDNYQQCIESDLDGRSGWRGNATTSQRKPERGEFRQPGGWQQLLAIRYAHEYGHWQHRDFVRFCVGIRFQHDRAFGGDLECRSKHFVQREVCADSRGRGERQRLDCEQRSWFATCDFAERDRYAIAAGFDNQSNERAVRQYFGGQQFFAERHADQFRKCCCKHRRSGGFGHRFWLERIGSAVDQSGRECHFRGDFRTDNSRKRYRQHLDFE